ncbi:MAG TPA: hypothetical protein VKC61_03215 [Pyrinomonadaceae bacterium]|nr:hypothetical protein [Pyrinomonadaceae bacterium]
MSKKEKKREGTFKRAIELLEAVTRLAALYANSAQKASKLTLTW